jgi:hypothetical protein
MSDAIEDRGTHHSVRFRMEIEHSKQALMTALVEHQDVIQKEIQASVTRFFSEGIFQRELDRTTLSGTGCVSFVVDRVTPRWPQRR